MIANAGIAQVKPLLELTEQDVERMFAINVHGLFNCYQIAAKQMIKQGTGGKIIGAARYVFLVSRLPRCVAGYLETGGNSDVLG